MSDILRLWTIYHRPRDMPDVEHVARLHEVGVFSATGAPDTRVTPHVIFGTLTSIRREFYNRGLTCIGRHDTDDPCIVEVWL